MLLWRTLAILPTVAMDLLSSHEVSFMLGTGIYHALFLHDLEKQQRKLCEMCHAAIMSNNNNGGSEEIPSIWSIPLANFSFLNDWTIKIIPHKWRWVIKVCKLQSLWFDGRESYRDDIGFTYPIRSLSIHGKRHLTRNELWEALLMTSW